MHTELLNRQSDSIITYMLVSECVMCHHDWCDNAVYACTAVAG